MVRVPLRRCWMFLVGSALTCSAWAGPADDAKLAYQRGDYTHAATLYEQAAEATPELRDDKLFMDAWHRAEARIAYAVGTSLHAEREYDAAVEQFMDAIAKDSDFEQAYTALEDARKAGIKQHMLVAMESADKGDLLTAKQRLERSLVLGGGAEEQINTALTSITAPEEAFEKATLDKLAEARRLAGDRQWELAEQQLLALVRQAPLLLPARAELSRVGRIKAMSNSLTDEAAALIAQQRLSPAQEKLVSATTVWPYNARAAELLETVETKLKRVNALVEQADKLQQQADWRGAYEILVDALAIDPSHADARALRSKVRVGLVKMLSEQALAALEQGDTDRARQLIDRGDQFWPNNRWTRQTFAAYQVALSDAADEAGRPGEAYLRMLLASRHTSLSHRLDRMERAFVRDAKATYAYDLAPSTPTFGVGSADLLGALATQTSGFQLTPASCIRLLHGGAPLDLAAPPVNDADEQPKARYHVSIQITQSDIDLRQRNNGSIAFDGATFGTTSGAFNSHYWEKFGEVRAAIQITDLTTGQIIDTFNSYRWANYTDRQQYVIGNTWNDQYWTLPTDQAIASRLANDLAAQIHTEVQEAVTLAKAQSLRAQAQDLAQDNPSASLDKNVAAVILAGQINPRQARIELWRMAKNYDADQPTPAE